MNNDINQLFEPLANALANHIDETARDNAARTDYWRIMSVNNWMNTDFQSLCEDCFGFLVQELPQYGRNDSVEGILADISVRWVRMDLAAWVLSNREMSNALDNDLYAKAQQLAQDRQNVLAQNERLMGAQNQFNNGGRNMGRNMGSYQGNNRMGSYSNNRMGGSGLGQNSRRMQSMNSGGLFTENGTQSQAPARRSGIGAVRDAQTQAAPAQPVREETPQRQAQPAQATPAPRAAAPVRQEVPEGPDYTLSKPYNSFFLKGEEWRPAHLSNWRLTWSPNQPFPTLFNPLTHMRYFVMSADKTVREEFLPMNNDQAYLTHSLVSNVQRGQEVQRPRYNSADAGDGHPAPVQPKVEEHPILKRTASAELNWANSKIITANSMEEAEVIVEIERLKGDQPNMVLSYARTVPLITDLTKYASLAELRSANNLTHAAEILRDAVGHADVSLWNLLNDRFTKAVNHVVEHQFGNFGTNSLRITDFSNDYGSLIDWIRTKKGETLARSFSQVTRHLVEKVSSKLEEPNVRQYMVNTIDITEEEFNANRPPVAVFEDFFTVMAVPFTSLQMGLMISSQSQTIDIESTPSLYRVVEKLSLASNEKLNSATIYLITKDLVRIEVLKSGMDGNTYLLRKLD